MSRANTRAAKSDRRRHWAYGVGLTAGALVVAVLPSAGRLGRSARELQRTQSTYTAKLSWVGQSGELERRVRERAAEAAALDAKLLTSADMARLTQAINLAARATGCSVRSTRPGEPRVLPRSEAKGIEARGKGEKPEARTEAVEWPVRVAVQGEYAQIGALLARLSAAPWHVRITRLAIQPSGEDREALSCELELAGYGLRSRPQGG